MGTPLIPLDALREFPPGFVLRSSMCTRWPASTASKAAESPASPDPTMTMGAREAATDDRDVNIIYPIERVRALMSRSCRRFIAWESMGWRGKTKAQWRLPAGYIMPVEDGQKRDG